ncbi:MAG: F0F1 ATP synthase subunit A [Candidatus Saccharibacteria bacterium]|nr:F0F1 ATP synthase subunit A [Candidatus Saccharibacteria bacterium]
MLSQLLSKTFAAENGIHISLKAEEIFHLGPLTVTNAMIYGVIAAIIIGFISIYAAKRMKVKTEKFGVVMLMETVVEYVINMLQSPFGSRSKAAKFAPIFAFYFLFILVNNLMGILPVVGPGIAVGDTPLFRPFTADLNGTIAMSVVAILLVQYMSIKEQGGKKHLQHYFSDKPYNPINFFIGVLEVFGEITKVISLSLRLFLNTAVGEILIAVFTSMIIAGGRTPVAVIPILLFEVLVAYIQAYVFTVLAGTYLGLAISHDDHEEHYDTEIGPGPDALVAADPDYSARAAQSAHHSPARLNNQAVGSDG